MTAAAGAVQLAAAWGAWRGDHWPRRILLALLAAEVAGPLLAYEFVFLGIILTGTATFLLWRSGARNYSTNVLATRRRPNRLAARRAPDQRDPNAGGGHEIGDNHLAEGPVNGRR